MSFAGRFILLLSTQPNVLIHESNFDYTHIREIYSLQKKETEVRVKKVNKNSPDETKME
jgi:ABC-type transporter lipoprotein component MlaA